MHRTSIRIGIALLCFTALSSCDFFVSDEARIARADKAAADSNYGLAAVEYRNVLHARPDNKAVRTKLVGVLLRSGDVNAATVEIEPLLHSATPDPAVADMRAQLYLSRGDFKGLLTALDDGNLKLAPAQALLRRGQALAGSGRPADAMAAVAEAFKTDPANEDVQTVYAQLLAASGQLGTAVNSLTVYVKTQPHSAKAWMLLGYFQSRVGQVAAADLSLKTARDNAKGHLSTGELARLLASHIEVQIGKSDIPAARDTLKTLVAAAPNSSVAMLSAAQIDFAAGDVSTAHAGLQKLLSAQPTLLPARLLLGRVLVAQNLLEQADTHVSKIVAENPQDIAPRKLLANIKLRQQNPSAALEVLAPATAGPSDPELNALLTAATAQSSKSADAISHLEASLARAPGDHELRLLLARVYLLGSQPAKAVELLRHDKDGINEPRASGLLLAAIATSQNSAAAVSEAQKIASANPDNLRMLNTIVEFMISQRAYAPAGDVVKRALARKPADASLLFMQAKLQVAAHDFAAASSTLQTIVANDPANVMAHVELARLALQDKKVDQAEGYLEEARARNPEALEPRLMLVELYLQNEQQDRADKIGEEIIAIAPERADLVNSLGEMQFRAQRNTQALDLFQRATKAQPTDVTSWMNVARAQIALNNVAGAREASDQSLKLKPNDPSVLRLAALVDIHSGNKQTAVDRVVKYRQAHADQPGAIQLEADVRMDAGQYAEAATIYQQVYDKAPASGVAIQLFRARSLGKLADAAAPLEGWLATHPNDTTAGAILAEHYQTSGERAKAIATYEHIVSIQPANAIARNNLAWLYHETGDSKALSMAKAAFDEAPDSVAVADTYGWVLLESGNTAGGLKILAAAANRAPQQPDIQYHYASALARTGARDEAVKRLTVLLKDFPAFSTRIDAQNTLDRLSGSTRSAT